MSTTIIPSDQSCLNAIRAALDNPDSRTPELDALGVLARYREEVIQDAQWDNQNYPMFTDQL